jgi:Glycosyl transferase family 2
MSIGAPRGLASIIVPLWNQLEFTRDCVAALKSHTRRPWELIVVDNGSTDGTPDYLAGVSDMADVPVTVITNATNRGFPAAVNQGLKAARGEYLVLLNNDVVVTDGWLEQLIGLVNARKGPLAAAGARTCAGDGNGSAGKSSPPSFGIVPDSAESTPPPCVGVAHGSAESTPPPCVGVAHGSAESTPPNPPSRSGGTTLGQGCSPSLPGVRPKQKLFSIIGAPG